MCRSASSKPTPRMAQSLPSVGELVGVEGHVRAMKATDAEMKNARGEG